LARFCLGVSRNDDCGGLSCQRDEFKVARGLWKCHEGFGTIKLRATALSKEHFKRVRRPNGCASSNLPERHATRQAPI
jgi:2-methylaconitate cis-trans-isomerase PrpF